MRKRHLLFTVFFISSLFVFNACKKDENNPLIPVVSDEERYLNAIEDAMIAEQNEICTNLIAINENNTYINWKGTGSDKKVLVVTWTNHPEYYAENSTLTNTWGEIWVTVIPEIEDWFIINYSGSDFVFRTEELLGLPRNNGKTHFVEMWVKPAYLWRPSPDNEVTDNTAELNFPTNADPSYQDWYNNTIIYSYYPMRYPWTRLGYTYDWGSSTTEIGLSEFVIQKNAEISIHKVTDNESFFNSIYN